MVYVHQYVCTPTGAGGVRSYECARSWVADDHDVTVITSSGCDDSVESGRTAMLASCDSEFIAHTTTCARVSRFCSGGLAGRRGNWPLRRSIGMCLERVLCSIVSSVAGESEFANKR